MAFKEYFTDNDFAEGIRNHDEVALKLLYKRHFQMIAHFVINNNGTYQEAKDIYQESIIVLYHNLNKEGFQLKSQLKTYIYSICKRLWLNELKVKKRKITLDDNFEKEDIADFNSTNIINEHEIRFNSMHLSLEKLGEPCSEIIKEFYLNKTSMEDIALKMGYTNAENAKTQKYKCLQRLKKIFFQVFKERMRSDGNNEG